MTDLVYSGLWEYIKGRVLGVRRVNHASSQNQVGLALLKYCHMSVHYTAVRRQTALTLSSEIVEEND